MLSSQSSSAIKSTAAAATAIVLTGVLVHKRNSITSCYHHYRGIQGILRFVWVGDHLPPNIRQSMDDLDEVEEKMIMAESELENIEILVERAWLESVDGPSSPEKSSTTDTVPAKQSSPSTSSIDGEDLQNQLFQQHPKLRKDIAIFSNRLDSLAATIDSIKSHSDDEVKRRKKQQSNKIVTLMNEMDRLISLLRLENR